MFDLDAAVDHVAQDTTKWGFESGVVIDTFCLAGEIGELVNVVKKLTRPDHLLNAPSRDVLRADLREELIDILIYWCKVARLADMNILDEWIRKDRILHERWDNAKENS